MFGLLHNLYVYLKKKSERKITLVLLGIDNAGKSTLSHTLQGELDKETSPTFGFNSATVVQGKYKIELFDLGGGKNIRSVWKKYLAEVHGVVFIVDAADPQRFEEAKQALTDTLTSDYLKDKPLLIMANKQDLATAVSAPEVAKSLGLADIVHNRYNILPCTAKTPAGQPVDTRVGEGMKWLISSIDSIYNKLNPRVQQEAETVRAEEAARKKEREERMRKAREERLRKQKEEEERLQQQQQEQDQNAGMQQNQNLLSDGKSDHAVAAPAGPAAAGLGLPNAIESPGKCRTKSRAASACVHYNKCK